MLFFCNEKIAQILPRMLLGFNARTVREADTLHTIFEPMV
jgi:hypothetical protein